MKNLITLILCFFLFGSFGCDKNQSEDLTKIDVDQYIELLKDGKYDALELPEFTSQDIPALLAYRNETVVITDFPVNMISSFVLPDCSLGLYVLWTVESIRAVSIDSEFLIGRFPSLNPTIDKKVEPYEIEEGSDVQGIIATAYYDWWDANKNKGFDDFKEIDPLDDTEYRWH